ncbi:MAG TPA: SCP2 sterol-binding domain-containing protein [Gammaproteobacteria bacterium]|nr:SCP2 sterol-binding domain-containing protein [Gammaproteobacteria bacterium]
MTSTSPPERLLAMLERALRHTLEFDPESGAALRQLQDRRIAIEFMELERTLLFAVTPQGPVLKAGSPEPVHVRLRGTLPSFIGLLQKGTAAGAAGVEIQGDLQTAQQLQAILKNMDIDWEEMLARRLGDVPAHQLTRVTRGAWQWLRGRARAFAQDFSEYGRFEAALLPEREEVEGFNTAVDLLRADTDRMAARVRRLRERTGPETGT